MKREGKRGTERISLLQGVDKEAYKKEASGGRMSLSALKALLYRFLQGRAMLVNERGDGDPVARNLVYFPGKGFGKG